MRKREKVRLRRLDALDRVWDLRRHYRQPLVLGAPWVRPPMVRRDWFFAGMVRGLQAEIAALRLLGLVRAVRHAAIMRSVPLVGRELPPKPPVAPRVVAPAPVEPETTARELRWRPLGRSWV